MKVKWETENSSDEFVVDLSSHTTRWESYFPSTAMGRKIKIEFYKNDLYDLTVKEVQGVFTPEPVLI